MVRHVKQHIYVDGGLLSWINSTGNKLAGDTGSAAAQTNVLGLTKGGTGLASSALGIGSSLIGSLANPNGNSTGVGNAMQSLGSVASAIPGIGGLIGAGVGALGTATNALFGSKLNNQFIDATQDKIKQQEGTQINAQSNEDLMNQAQQTSDLQHVSRSQVGTQGVFSHSASNKANSLNRQIDKANYTLNMNLNNAANNIDTNTNMNLQNNYYAGGGYLPSQGIRQQISHWEGSSMKNNIPMSIKAKEVASITPNFDMLSQSQKDALFSYYYNVKPSTYKQQIVPLMSQLNYNLSQPERMHILNGVANSINTGMNRPGMSGLTDRRLYEQSLFRGNNPTDEVSIPQSQSQLSNNNYSQPDVLYTQNPQSNNLNFATIIGNQGVPDNSNQAPVYQNAQDLTENNISPFDIKFATNAMFEQNAHVQPHQLADGGSLNNNNMFDPNYFANGGSIHINPANKGKLTATVKRTGKSIEELAHSKNPTTRKRAQFALNARHFNHKHEDGGDLSDDEIFDINDNDNIYASGGGLSRASDYGSSKKPYPSVAASDFAGGGRSYPIPTEADAVDALRLAGLHGRNDVKAKVYAKYPDLKHSKADGGPIDVESIFANGGSIDINPANRGKFTATMERTGKTAHELLHSSNPLTRKRANFAINFGHVQADGGGLNTADNTNGGIFSNGVSSFNTGGTHEQNPNGGIPQGVASDGQPNLVEQGETKYNNYIYSNRNKPSGDLLKLVGLQKSMKNKSFSEAAKKISKESKERPNDPISKRGLKADMGKLQAIQELQRAAQAAQQQGQQQAPQGQQQMQPDQSGMQGQPQQAQAVPVMHAYGGHLYDDGSMLDNPLAAGYTIPNGPVGVQQPQKGISTMQYAQQQFQNGPSYNQDIGNLANKFNARVAKATNPGTNSINNYSQASGLRYAPAIGSGIQALSDLVGASNKPNYANANLVGDAVNHLQPISSTPVGNYMAYKPFDTQFYQNKLANQQTSSRNALINNSGGNRANAAAGILASDMNYNNNMGDLARQADESNFNQRLQVQNFNRGTNEYNSDNAMRAGIYNQQNQQLNLSGRLQQANLMQQADTLSSQAKSANLTYFLQNLGNVGTDTYWRNAANSNPAMAYLLGPQGQLVYKATMASQNNK